MIGYGTPILEKNLIDYILSLKVLLIRINGLTNFYRNWKQYKEGFGSVFGEYWIGKLAEKHCFNIICNSKNMTLQWSVGKYNDILYIWSPFGNLCDVLLILLL